MLLELDASEIKRLLVNPSDLAVAVAKAKMEYVQFVQKEERSSAATTTTTPSGRFNTAQAQEIIGETLYTIVQNDYPDDASQITGNRF